MSDPVILDGKKLASDLTVALHERVEAIIDRTGRTPILATVLVGDDPASRTYVKMKGNACKRAGFKSVKKELPAESSTQEVVAAIAELNQDPDVHGILLQHPVPNQVDEPACFNAISPEKDVDGVTYLSFARTAMNDMLFGCATPVGIMRILKHYAVPLEGKEAVVVGRSPILGKPIAMMLLNENATVTVCHSRTTNLPSVVARGDIVVAAVGKPEFIKADWIKPGAVVVDAGYNPGNVGDADLKNMIEIVSAYTPVPGGVGPMTIYSLIEQTVTAAERRLGLA